MISATLFDTLTETCKWALCEMPYIVQHDDQTIEIEFHILNICLTLISNQQIFLPQASHPRVLWATYLANPLYTLGPWSVLSLEPAAIHYKGSSLVV